MSAREHDATRHGSEHARERSHRELLSALRASGARPELVEGLATLVGALEEDLRDARRALSGKAFALGSLVDASRDFGEPDAEDAVLEAVLTSAMGHFLVARAAVYRLDSQGFVLAGGRGLHPDRRPVGRSTAIPANVAEDELKLLGRPVAVTELADGALRRLLTAGRFALAAPLSRGGQVEGVLAIGERASSTPFSGEDREVAAALAAQASAAVENARLRRVREEKKRQDRELQLAREIQESLLPTEPPRVQGFELAGRSRPCFEVGGDCYDWIPLADGRLAFTVGDVAGKGTPASLLMASVHASVQLLAGMAGPAELVARVNRFLAARAPASRFVTLLYAELDPASRRLVYVNAGHVPPYRVARSGVVSRLRAGGPALGLIADASYDVGDVVLEPGDVVAVVSDGVTEAESAADEEFGDRGVCETVHALAREPAAGILDGLVAAVEAWRAGAGFADDLTAIVLKTLL